MSAVISRQSIKGSYATTINIQALTLLHWGHVLKRRQFGETINCEPSRFIAELPSDDLQWQGGDADTVEANEERGKETLAGLKNLFG